MFIVKGSTRTVRCYPTLGIVIKTPIECLGDFGIKANKAEAYLWKRTRNPLLAPVLFSFFGKIIVMRYYPNKVNEGSIVPSGRVTKEFFALLREEYPKIFIGIAEKILGKRIAFFFEDGHIVQADNFRLTEKGKLVMIDYGITCSEHQNEFENFLDENGIKLVSKYSEKTQ